MLKTVLSLPRFAAMALWLAASVAVAAGDEPARVTLLAGADDGTGAVDGTAPSQATWTSAVPPSTTGFLVKCFPDGTCDSKTVFFCRMNTAGTGCDPTGPAFELRAKLSIMRLGGAIGTRTEDRKSVV